MTEHPAASKMRSNLRRHVSGSKTQQLRCSTENGGSGSTLVDSLEHHADEHTALLHRAFQNSDGEPFYKDERPWVRWPSRFGYVAWQTLTSNPVNVLLVFVPLGIISGTIGWSSTVVFVLNFLAIIPLASLLSFATEEISVKLGQTLGGLMNATFGNAVELIVSIVALKNGEIRIVQASMLGSILSNILLVLGCCFLAGGIKHKEQKFNSTVASTMSSLMAVSTASLIIPATLYAAMGSSNTKDKKDDNILILSHGTAIILLVLYGLYLFFQLKTHADFFDEESGDNDSEEEPAERHILSPWAAGVALVIVTVAVAVCAEFLVDSIDAIVETAHVSRTFIGLILLPIVGNAAEHVTAVVVATKNKMDLAIGVAIGSSMQIALLVTPFLVVLGWIMNQPMSLHFEIFETVVFFLSVLVTNYLISDGKSNYLEGAMLIGMYIIVALAFYVYPDDAGGDAKSLWTLVPQSQSPLHSVFFDSRYPLKLLRSCNMTLLHSILHATNFSRPFLSTLVPSIGLAYTIQGLVAIPSIFAQTERFYDLSGSFTYISCTALSLYLPTIRARAAAAAVGAAKPAWPSILAALAGNGSLNWRQVALSAAVSIWATRLGTYLFSRITSDNGTDSRFDNIRSSPPKFLGAFFAQATWVSLCLMPVLALNSLPASLFATLPAAISLTDILGLLLYVGGLSFEVTADRQKDKWVQEKKTKKHNEEFLTRGLWSKSRHPNYFGEVTLWTGIATLAGGVLVSNVGQVGMALAASGLLGKIAALGLAGVSPAFVSLLLFKVSGIPLSEGKYDKRYGERKDYQEWKKNTPMFFPKF
ncbi:MAG: hypothetical protein Q9177_000604 [Variospora cf. flavescens]